MALTGARFPLHGSDPFARAIGYPSAPLDDLLVFHVVFGKTVPDVSLNAVANLGYAACVFGAPVQDDDMILTDDRHAVDDVNDSSRDFLVGRPGDKLQRNIEVLFDQPVAFERFALRVDELQGRRVSGP